MSCKRYKLTIAYDGSTFEGWQKQKKGRTVQSVLEEKLAVRFQTAITIHGAGRTDTGVHAQGQVAHCDLALEETEDAVQILQRSLNRMLAGESIHISKIESVTSDFHARYSATGKHYVYRIRNVEKPLLKNYSLLFPTRLDMNKLCEAATMLCGKHDFKALANENHKGTAAINSVREIWDIVIIPIGACLEIHFIGQGFLYKMVRNCTALLLDIASGKRDMNAIQAMFETKQRPTHLMCAPPQALTLFEVFYSSEAHAVTSTQLNKFKASMTRATAQVPSLYL